MREDPTFLKYDFEFLFADQWLSKVLIKFGARKFGLLERNLSNEEIPAYQEHVIKLFESVPWFMPS